LFACALAAGRSLCVILFYYGRKHRPCEALNAGVVGEHPLASACCSCIGIVTIVIATTPNNASAATMAMTAIEVCWFIIRL
jgi:hypothetical protein